MAGPIVITVVTKASQALAGLGTVGKAAGAAATAVVAIAASSAKVEAEFSRSMRLVAANTGASTKELKKLEQQATTLGPKLGFGARESADAMLELAKAGLDAKQILGGGLASTLRLASAGATSLGTASTIGANAMNSFGLKAAQMDQITVALAGGANASTASVESLGQALSQVGPGARTAGLSLQETVAVLSAFDNAGIKGSDAGTSLKTMLTRLVPQTDRARNAMNKLGLDFTNADGSFQSITEVAQQLKNKLGGLTDEQRTTALATIFGSDATRAATVLAREGAAGLGKYIKATRDRSAAEKAVKAETEGASGAFKRFTAAVESAQLKIGAALAPAIIAGADALSGRLVPAVEDAIKVGSGLVRAYKADGLDGLVRRVEDLTGAQGKLTPILNEARDAVDGLWRIFKQIAPAFLDASNSLSPLLSPLSLVGDVANVAADVLERLPDGLLSVGIQAGIAAAILPRLAGAATATGNAFAIATTRAIGFGQALRSTGTAAQTQALGRLGGAARSAAGVGGLLALSASAQSTNDTVKVLGSTAGGALLGFSLAGPIGGAIGAGAGALLGLAQRTDGAKAAMEKAAPAAGNYADTLDELTGATTRATRAEVFKQLTQSGAISQAKGLGVATRDLVAAVLGQDGALQRVNAQLEKTGNYTLSYSAANGDLVTEAFQTQKQLDATTRQLILQGYAYDDLNVQKTNTAKTQLLDVIGRESDAWAASTKAKRAEILATQDLSVLRRKIPKKIITQIEATGIVPTTRGVAKVARQYGVIDKRQVRALIEATGVDLSVRRVRKVIDALNGVDKVRPKLTGAKQGIARGVREAEDTAGRGGKKIREAVEKPVGQTKANLKTLKASLPPELAAVQSSARTGGVQIGAALKGGIVSGFAGTAGILAGQARAAVRAAISAGRAEGKIHSPSKETDYTGRMLGDGLIGGLAKKKNGAKKGGRDLVLSLLAGVTSGTDGVSKALDKLTSLIEKRINLKDSGKEAKREREVIKSLRDQYAALRRNAKLQDSIAAKLGQARDRYKQLVNASKAYAASIKDSFVSYGSVIALGQGDGFANAGQLIDQLRTRVANAQRFAELIKQLSKTLNKTTLQQLIDAGVEGGLGTAEAIAAGGASAIAQINDLTAQLGNTGGALGTAMANQFHSAGIQAAQAVVEGLQKRQRQLDRVAEGMAAALAAAVRKALGIKGGGKSGGAAAAGASTTAAQPVTQQITVKVEVGPGADPVKVGREITRALDAYRRAGGRSAA